MQARAGACETDAPTRQAENVKLLRPAPAERIRGGADRHFCAAARGVKRSESTCSFAGR